MNAYSELDQGAQAISVVMTTYNGAEFLPEQLQSIATQTVQPAELCVGDDGSEDSTLDLVSDFSRSSNFPVRIHRNPIRLGFKRNFLETAGRASFPVIAFCDQDDVWVCNKLEKIQEAMRDPAVWMCSHKARLIDSNGVQVGVLDQGITRNRLLHPGERREWPLYYGFSMATRREVIQLLLRNLRSEVGELAESRYAHDQWVAFVCALFGCIFEINEYLVDYRQHSSSVVGARPERERFSTSEELMNNQLYSSITTEQITFLERAAVGEQDLAIRKRASEGVQIYRRVLRHIQTKNECQSAPSSLQGFLILMKNLLKGHYRDAYDGTFRWRSCAHDLIFLPRRFWFGE